MAQIIEAQSRQTGGDGPSPSRRRRRVLGAAAGLLLVGAFGATAVAMARDGGDAVAADRAGGSAPAGTATAEAKIASAMSAGPEAVSRDATILDWKSAADEPYPVLRKGSNGWTCFPDDPAYPGLNPGCLDTNTMTWLNAYYAGETPRLSAPGISYWYQGSSDASMTDPFATEPAPGEDWVIDGPHITIIPAGKIPASDYAAHGAHHGMAAPSVMWRGSLYEHIHVPIR